MPTPRSGLVAVLAGNLIYAIGGHNNYGQRDEVEALDPATGTWISGLAPLPTARTTPGAALGPDGRIYVVGGANAGGFPVDTLEAYDPQTNSWASLSPMTTDPTRPRHRWGVVAVTGPDGRIYAIGGSEGTGPLDYVDIYDPATNHWSEGTPLPSPFKAYYMAAAKGVDGRIYAMGGFNMTQYLDDAFAYDTATRQWAPVAPMPMSRSNGTAVARDGLIYVFAGGNPEGRVRDVVGYDSSTNTWTVELTPLPQGRMSPASAMGSDGRIYLIGGALPPAHYFDSVQTYQSCSNPQDILPPVDCSQESSLRSASGPATVIQFINNTGAERRLYWLNYTGDRVLYATLNSGAGLLQSTYSTHPWVIADSSGNCQAIHVGTASPGRVEIDARPTELTAISDCASESTFRSEVSTTPTSIQFINNLSVRLKIYWLNFVGERELFATLDPGRGLRQLTHLTHPWVVTGSNDVCQMIYQPVDQPTRATRSIP